MNYRHDDSPCSNDRGTLQRRLEFELAAGRWAGTVEDSEGFVVTETHEPMRKEKLPHPPYAPKGGNVVHFIVSKRSSLPMMTTGKLIGAKRVCMVVKASRNR